MPSSRCFYWNEWSSHKFSFLDAHSGSENWLSKLSHMPTPWKMDINHCNIHSSGKGGNFPKEKSVFLWKEEGQRKAKRQPFYPFENLNSLKLSPDMSLFLIPSSLLSFLWPQNETLKRESLSSNNYLFYWHITYLKSFTIIDITLCSHHLQEEFNTKWLSLKQFMDQVVK